VGAAVGIDHSGACLAGNDDASGYVPGPVSHSDAGVQATIGKPGQVERGGTEHADAVHPRGELGCDGLGCIGIDDGSQVGESGLVSGDTDRAGEFEQLFRAVYLTFHRRDAPRGQLAAASLAVLEHLALAGPLTIGEAAAHLRRAQSVVSEIVSHLERQGLLERESDPADRRRTLVWLTLAGQTTLRRQREVLSEELLAGALGRMPPEQVGALLGALRALVQSVTPSPAAAGHSEGNPS
jgi:DNA-binding MarR family transcriptional regulator